MSESEPTPAKPSGAGGTKDRRPAGRLAIARARSGRIESRWLAAAAVVAVGGRGQCRYHDTDQTLGSVGHCEFRVHGCERVGAVVVASHGNVVRENPRINASSEPSVATAAPTRTTGTSQSAPPASRWIDRRASFRTRGHQSLPALR